jgi:tetratricopeptide (TPR) repeat protein
VTRELPLGAPEAASTLPDPLNQSWDRFSRVAVMLGVVTTLIAAVVGWQHSEAGKNADAASARAHALTVEASQIHARSQHLQQIALTVFAEGRELASRARSMRQAEMFGDEQTPAAALDDRRWGRLAAATDEKLERLAAERAWKSAPTLGDISSGGAYAPAEDPLFPGRFRARGEREATQKLALRDAANERNVEWDKRGNRYVAALAMLGTALYLFGFSLSPHVHEVRGYFLGTALVLLLIAGGWALVNIIVPVRGYPERAAEEFARGHVLLVSSTEGPGLERARRHFDEAIDLRPTFARAYEEREQATWLSETPQRATFSSLTTPAALTDAIEDLEKARYLGAESSGVAGGLGFAKVLLGLRADDSGLIEEGAHLTREALDEAPDNPQLRSNLAVAQLALGQLAEAADSYREATKDRPRDRTIQGGWLSGTFTDLELVAQYQASARDQVRELKQRILSALAGGGWSRPTRGPTFRGVSVYADPAYLQVEVAGFEGFEPDEEQVSTHWYQKTALGWTHLESASGLAVPMQRAGDGTIFQLIPFLRFTAPPTCLPATEFRAELYVGGWLAGRARGGSQPGPTRSEPFADADTYMLGCRPASWRKTIFKGVANGYVSQDASRGVYVLRLNDLFPDLPLAKKDEAALERTIPALAGAFPAPPSPARNERYATAFLGTELTTPDPAVVPAESDRESIRMYRYRGGRIVAGAHVDPDGSIKLGLVYGDDVVSYRAHPVFESLSAW